MRKVLLSLQIILTATFLNAQTHTETYTAPSSVSVDGCGTYCVALPALSFSSSDFASGCMISDVDVTINWAKTDGSCTSPGTGDSFHAETNFRIDGPPGNEILAIPGTWSGSATTSSVTTTFSQGNPIPSGTSRRSDNGCVD